MAVGDSIILFGGSRSGSMMLRGTLAADAAPETAHVFDLLPIFEPIALRTEPLEWRHRLEGASTGRFRHAMRSAFLAEPRNRETASV